MRRVIGYSLLGLGVFALALGLMLRLYAYPRLAKVPHDPDSVSVATGGGVTALVYVGRDDGSVTTEIRHDLNLTSTTHVVGDLTQPVVREGSEVTSWVEATVVKADNPDIQPLSGSVRRLCIDRHTGRAVAPCVGQFIQTESDPDKPVSALRDTAPRDVIQQPGYSFKLPFSTEKKSYPFYNLSIEGTAEAKFAAEDTIRGFEVYRFVYDIPATKISEEKIAVPGRLVGKPDDPTVQADLYFSARQTMWVDPVTGAIIALERDVHQELRIPGEGTGEATGEATTVFDGTLSLTDETITRNVAAAKENRSKLALLTELPNILYIAGPVLMIVGIALLLRRGSSGENGNAAANPPPMHVDTKAGA